ncbi:MAG: M91 family zinc metallopeptidase [Iamia sp.]
MFWAWPEPGWIDIPGRTYTERLVDEHGEVIEERTVPRPELNSVGLDLDGDGDFDTVGAGNGTTHPVELTENALRRELGLPERDSYEFGADADRDAGDSVEYGDTGD